MGQELPSLFLSWGGITVSRIPPAPLLLLSHSLVPWIQRIGASPDFSAKASSWQGLECSQSIPRFIYVYFSCGDSGIVSIFSGTPTMMGFLSTTVGFPLRQPKKGTLKKDRPLKQASLKDTREHLKHGFFNVQVYNVRIPVKIISVLQKRLVSLYTNPKGDSQESQTHKREPRYIPEDFLDLTQRMEERGCLVKDLRPRFAARRAGKPPRTLQSGATRWAVFAFLVLLVFCGAAKSLVFLLPRVGRARSCEGLENRSGWNVTLIGSNRISRSE